MAGSGAIPKVNHHLSSLLLSLMKYPCMFGLNPEQVLRPSSNPVNPLSTPGVLTSRGWPNKGPADVYLPSSPPKLPHPGLAEGSQLPVQLPQELPSLSRELPSPRPAICPKQPVLQQRPLPPREQPHQVGLAEVLPRRVRTLLGPRASAANKAATEAIATTRATQQLVC